LTAAQLSNNYEQANKEQGQPPKSKAADTKDPACSCGHPFAVGMCSRRHRPRAAPSSL